MFETVYHGVPILTLPVFCDHNTNSAKAELDGYAINLELSTLTAESLLWGIRKLIHNPKYKEEVKYRQFLLKDQSETPLEKAVYWTEYIIRHKGAKHLESSSRDLSIPQYYLLDVICVLLLGLVCSYYFAKYFLRLLYKLLTSNINFSLFKKSIKLE